MARQELSRTQRFLTSLVDAETAAAMEAHSRAWLVTCRNCGLARSVWDLGGIRYKAGGKDTQMGHCPDCGVTGWHDRLKAANFPATQVPSGSLVRAILLLTLVPLVLVAAIVMLALWLTGII